LSQNKGLFIIYNYFTPAYKAGGPVQSLQNLASLLENDIEVSVACSCHDLNETKILDGITPGKWCLNSQTSVYYLKDKEASITTFRKLLKDKKPSTLYLNGIYLPVYVVLPLITWKLYFRKKIKVVLSPRGMLQEGGMKANSFQKKAFIGLFKLLGLHKGIVWHATDEQEKEDVRKYFGQKSNVCIVPNIPKIPWNEISLIEKHTGDLRLVYLSLISEKKNLHLAIEWLKELKLPIILDIYGPVKDIAYWEKCKGLMKDMPEEVKISYRGDVIPDKVQSVFSDYHALILPTKGENFGHSIYECLSVGRPVIISDKTFWKNLNKIGIGYDLDLAHTDEFKKAIVDMYDLNQERYNEICLRARDFAAKYYMSGNFKKQYIDLF